jgi:hypothetical protein
MQQRWLALPGANEIFLSLCVCVSVRATLFSPTPPPRRLHGKVLKRNRKFRDAAGIDGGGGALKIVIPSSLWAERLEI